jgi:hypothetical protein
VYIEGLQHGTGTVYAEALSALNRAAGGGCGAAADINDHLGHAAVMRVYDAAIADVERRMNAPTQPGGKGEGDGRR